MYSFRKRYLFGAVLAVALFSAVFWLTGWVKPETEQTVRYCNAFAESVPLVANFDPDHPTDARENAAIPEPAAGGCYDTQAEAVCAGTGGAICLPENATAQEIDWAIRDYEYTHLGSQPNPGPWGWQPPDS